MKMFFLFLMLFIGMQTTGWGDPLCVKSHGMSYANGSRFGDRVLVYAQARYLSYSTGVPFLYRPFPYSDLLEIDYEAKSYDQCKDLYQETFYIDSAESFYEFFRKIRNPHTLSTLFIVNYFPAEISEWDFSPSLWSVAFDIPWKDPKFNNYLRKSLVPKIRIPKFRQEGHLNVATHVRTLSGDDLAHIALTHFPLKFPSTDYQKRQIRRVYEWNLRRPMYVFLFSDTKDPQGLIKEFQDEFQGTEITFGIQFLQNADLNNVVQDFFGMLQFDVLIATKSNFSSMPACLGNFDMVIYPVHATGRYPQPSQIDRIQVITKLSSWFPFEINVILKEEF